MALRYGLLRSAAQNPIRLIDPVSSAAAIPPRGEKNILIPHDSGAAGIPESFRPSENRSFSCFIRKSRANSSTVMASTEPGSTGTPAKAPPAKWAGLPVTVQSGIMY
jgi:hypothetical protein